MFLCPCLEVRYKFRMQTTFGSSLPSVDCMTGRFLIDDICACLRIIVSSTCWQNEPHGGHHLRAHGLIPGFGEVRISNVYFILCVLFVVKTKPNETKSNETKRNRSKRNEIKRNETTLHFVSFRSVSFRFVWFRFVSFGFVSFRFRFALYRYLNMYTPRFMYGM